MDKCIFISYKRASITTPIAETFYRKVKINLEGIGFKNTFFDRKSIEAGDHWSQAIDDALDRTTHFIALLSDEYWLSEQCQRELLGAVERNESGGSPILLFVLTELMDPQALVIDRTQSRGALQRKFPQIERLSEINFLGPYDDAGRLIRLNCTDPMLLGDQIFRLIETIKSQT